MKYINTLAECRNLRIANKKIIVCSAGSEGTRFMDYLYYNGLLGNILCVTEVPGANNQKFVDTRPVIPLSYLPHFREDALFLVAAPLSRHEWINGELNKFGCKNVVFLGNTFHEKVIGQLNNFSTSGAIALWTTKNLLNRMNVLEERIAEQNEISAVHTKTFAEYRNCFRDKEVVLVATGPTLKYYKPIPDAIHIGVNFAWRREDIPFNFLFAQDFGGERRDVVNGFDKIIDGIFIGKFLDLGVTSYLNRSMDVEFLSDKIRRYYLNETSNATQHLCQDICHHALTDFSTTVSAAFQFALYTYPKKLYIVGCDTSLTGHFYNETKIQKIDFTRVAKVGYARLKMHARKFYTKTEIISINPVGLKGLFTDVYTDEYKASLEPPTDKKDAKSADSNIDAELADEEAANLGL